MRTVVRAPSMAPRTKGRGRARRCGCAAHRAARRPWRGGARPPRRGASCARRLGPRGGFLMRGAYIRLVGLDPPAEQLPRIGPEGRGHLVQQQPGRAVAPDPRVALELEGGDALLVATHEEQRQEPDPQRHPGPVQDRPRRERGLVAAGRALREPTAAKLVGLPALTARAAEAPRPARPPQARPTGALDREAGLELEQGARERHRRPPSGGHPHPAPCQARSGPERRA